MAVISENMTGAFLKTHCKKVFKNPPFFLNFKIFFFSWLGTISVCRVNSELNLWTWKHFLILFFATAPKWGGFVIEE